MPEVHVVVEVEQQIRRLLGELRYWPEVQVLESSIGVSVEQLRTVTGEIEERYRDDMHVLLDDLVRSHAKLCKMSGSAFLDFLTLTEEYTAEHRFMFTRARGRRLGRALRRSGHLSAFGVQAAISRHHQVRRRFSMMRRTYMTRLVAVVGEAGSGKTHLGASLTAETKGRPSGIYLEAWPLGRRDTVDDLVPRLRGLSANTFEEVLDAAESAAVRAGARLPVMIDGLSDSEDPAAWKSELETLRVVLQRFPSVVLVVTLRPSARSMTLPQGISEVMLRGFSRFTAKAVNRYFDYYKIDRSGLHIPLLRFNNPLFLRIFCEATNADRVRWKRAEEVPGSLVVAFRLFRDRALIRIAERPGGPRRLPSDIRTALESIARSLWDTRRRAIPFDELRALIHDTSQDWSSSLAQAFVDEGILSRDTDHKGAHHTVILFDAFAGFLVADELLGRMSQDDFVEWIANDCVLSRLGTVVSQAHPLSADIRAALSALTPRRYRIQLWTLLNGTLRHDAIVAAADLEASLLDDETVTQIGRIAMLPLPRFERDLFDRFLEVHDVPTHPLNAEFLNQILSETSVPDRDLRWTEWIRKREENTLIQLRSYIDQWRSEHAHTQKDQLQAVWTKWLLTSTARCLRDTATLALYWCGRGDLSTLLQLTMSSLTENDPYVPERLLAATFGVMMAESSKNLDLDDGVIGFLDRVWTTYYTANAAKPTSHALIREYVRGIMEITERYFPHTFRQSRCARNSRFTMPNRVRPILSDDKRNEDGDLLYGFDFKNYTVGRLVPDRRNYDYDHPGYQEVLSWIRGRVWDLGWRADRFEEAEREISESRGYAGRIDPSHLDPYAKKYGWIGFYEAAGRLHEEGRLPLHVDDGRLSDIDIDPSFPRSPPALRTSIDGWLPCEPLDPEAWTKRALVKVPDEILRSEYLNGQRGHWLALHGFLRKKNVVHRREVFGFLKAILVRRSDIHELKDALHSRRYPGNHWLPDPPVSYYSFAGEMPWSAGARQWRGSKDLRGLYLGTIRTGSGREITVEIPVHEYLWEAYHSCVNDSGGGAIPAITFADKFDLRAIPNSLDWCDDKGERVSMTVGSPVGFESGNLLYIKERLLNSYCEAHDYALVWIVWGERNFDFGRDPDDIPESVRKIYVSGSHIWRRVSTLDEVAPSGVSS